MSPRQASTRGKLLAWIISTLMKVLAGTLRYDFREVPSKIQPLETTPFIISIWHNRLALSLSLYRRLVARPYPSHRMAALVSASKDGAILSEILTRFHVQPVRGSSSRRGPQALKELVHWANEGWDLAVTPDGPRGPCYQIQNGVIYAAQLTGHPILPVSFHLSRKLTLKSWDRFQIPLPFSKCTVHVAEPIVVPREMDDTERAATKERLQAAMDSVTRD